MKVDFDSRCLDSTLRRHLDKLELSPTNSSWFIFLFFHSFQVTSSEYHPDVSFIITSCRISPHSDPKMDFDYKLIETFCPTDDSVTFLPPRPSAGMENKRFSFFFSSTFNRHLLFLHCELSLCSKTTKGSQQLPLVCDATVIVRCDNYAVQLIFKKRFSLSVFADLTVSSVSVCSCQSAVLT